MHVCIHVCMYVWLYVCMHTCTHACTCQMCLCMYIPTYICIHIYIYSYCGVCFVIQYIDTYLTRHTCGWNAFLCSLVVSSYLMLWFQCCFLIILLLFIFLAASLFCLFLTHVCIVYGQCFCSIHMLFFWMSFVVFLQRLYFVQIQDWHWFPNYQTAIGAILFKLPLVQVAIGLLSPSGPLAVW